MKELKKKRTVNENPKVQMKENAGSGDGRIKNMIKREKTWKEREKKKTRRKEIIMRISKK